MIEPVSRVQSYNGVSSVGTKSGNSDSSTPFSMDQAIAEESAREEGVYYERSSSQKPEQNQPKDKKVDKDSSDIIEILFFGTIVPGKDLHPVLHQRCCHIILGGKRIGTRHIDCGTGRFQSLA